VRRVFSVRNSRNIDIWLETQIGWYQSQVTTHFLVQSVSLL